MTILLVPVPYPGTQSLFQLPVFLKTHHVSLRSTCQVVSDPGSPTRGENTSWKPFWIQVCELWSRVFFTAGNESVCDNAIQSGDSSASDDRS